MRGRMRVAALASGSGNTLWKAHDLQISLEKTFEGSPFEVVAVFSDNPESKALITAMERCIPFLGIDIKDFYARRGKPLKDREVRGEYDALIMDFFEEHQPDVILLAGYVWATTDTIIESLPVINVHPADLSIKRDGKRLYAGANGVGAALEDGASELRSSSHIATAVLDSGPVLVISPPVPVDRRDGLEGQERMKYYLRQVNDQSREVGARTIYEVSLGNFGVDEKGAVCYRGHLCTDGLKFESWEHCKPLYERETGKLLKPESVAVIGASSKPGLGKAVLKNILDYGFPGKVFGINRKGEDVLGVKGYRSVKEIKDDIDLALVTVPAEYAPGVVRECGEKGVPTVAALTAGFKEMGEAGAKAEAEMMNWVDHYNMRLLGPNCMGLLNTDPEVRLHSNMLQTLPKRGGIGLITQSGAIGAALLDWAEDLGLGFSMIASTGNQPDLDICDLLPIFAEDHGTKVILAYLEMIPDPARFERIMQKVTPKKPVVILKSGRTASGAAAARSHTGSLAGNERIAEALIRKTGAIRANTLEEAFLLSSALSRLPLVMGNRVGIISNAGGPGTLVADMLDELGFELPLLPETVRNELARDILPQASTANPLDLVATAAPEHYGKASRLMAESGMFDALIVIMVPPATIETGLVAQAMIDSLKSISIPVLSCFFGPGMGLAGRNVMLDGGIPSFPFPEQTAQVLHLMRRPALNSSGREELSSFLLPSRDRVGSRRIISSNRGSFLSPEDAESLIEKYGFSLARSGYITSPDQIPEIDLKYPLVAKIDHPEVIHKSDAGGVVLGISDRDALDRTVRDLLERFPGSRGILLQEQVRGEMEIILGANKDPLLGHAVLVGYGGTGVEVFEDVAIAHVPFGKEGAKDLLRQLKCYRILEGHRGKKGIDLDKLAELILRLEAMLLDNPEIEELDLNPLIFDGRDLVVADSRIRIEV